jgi:RimJ/RimL family protein N-acetyltransferase
MNDRPRVTLRQATLTDQSQILDVITESRREAMPWLPIVHTPAEDEWWVANKLIPESDVWVADRGGEVVGVCAMVPGWIEQLYIATSAQGTGLGSDFIRLAKSMHPDGLQLYCFAENHRAAAFYRSRGFEVIATGDGSGNEEGQPDLLFAWRPERDAAGVSAVDETTTTSGGPVKSGVLG